MKLVEVQQCKNLRMWGIREGKGLEGEHEGERMQSTVHTGVHAHSSTLQCTLQCIAQKSTVEHCNAQTAAVLCGDSTECTHTPLSSCPA